MHIDQNEETTYVETPYDDAINNLNTKLNATYIPYGKKGQQKKQNQISQDMNAENYSKSNVSDRAAFKSSKKYKADDWDLVDAYKKDKNIVNNLETMPNIFQNISVEEMETRIQQIATKREALQNEMQALDKKRREYKAEKSKEATNGGLQESMLKSIREQARKKGFKIKN